MNLNNWLQVHGGIGRLAWGEAQFGPQHCPVWRAVALS